MAGRVTSNFELFSWRFDREETYFYVVLAWVIAMFVMAANLMRSRDGRALVAAVREVVGQRSARKAPAVRVRVDPAAFGWPV